VSAGLSVAALFLLTGTLFALPLLPAIWELQSKSDAAPLNVIQQHAGEIRYFADSFRGYLQPLEPLLRECALSGQKAAGVMPDGTQYLVLGSGSEAINLPLGEKDRLCPVLLASGGDLTVGSDSTFSHDVYSQGRFVGGSNNQYRALMANYELHLGQNSRVMRWVHAGGELNADSDCKLYGRASSDTRIRLGSGCTFLRLNAPRIEFGKLPTRVSARTSDVSSSPASIPSTRVLHEGDFEVQPGEVFHGDLVIRGRLRIGSGARVLGSIKTGKQMVIEPGVRIEGSLICATKLLIGPNCLIQGPVISEREVLIQSGTECGTAYAPTTVSAPRIRIVAAVVVFGTVWARDQGEVLVSL
jgi:predicted acyltransferase (DUF342 family)